MIILRNIAVLLVTSVTLNILYNDYFKHDDDENHTPGYRCDCGIKREFDVSNNAFLYPWLVTIYSDFGQCRGSILASKYIVTTAHCVTREDGTALDPDQIVVVPGFHNRPKSMTVSKVSVHERYVLPERIEKRNDIAILELSKRLDLNIYTPACIPQTSDNWIFDEYHSEVLALREEEVIPLHSFHVSPLHYYQCLMRELLPINEFNLDLAPSVICSQKISTEFLRKGDSGGPLLYEEKDQYNIIGIITGGNDKVRLQLSPDVEARDQVQFYSSFSFYKDWITSKMRNPEYCLSGSSGGNISFANEEKVEVKRMNETFSWWDLIPLLSKVNGLYLLFKVDIFRMGRNIFLAMINPRKFIRGEITILQEFEQVYPSMMQEIMDNLIRVLAIPIEIILQFSQRMPRFFL